MNKFTNLRTFNPLLTLLLFVAVAFMSACGGDDEPTPDCSTLTLTATAEGFTITATATGGKAPYEFQLDGGTVQSSGTFADLEAGSYVVTVIDDNQCTKTQSVQVTDPCADFSVSATASAYDITIDVEGGTAPYQYLITYTGFTDTENTSEQSVSFSVDEALATGIVVTDANGCERQASVTAEAIASFTDTRDDQTYKVVKIGDQIWFAENFNYNTNTADSTSSWYYNDDQATYEEQYGRLYTWYVAQEIAPEGWSLPSAADYQQLIDGFVGEVDAIEALEVGGSSGFEFKLGGRYRNDDFFQIDDSGYIWSSTENNSDQNRATYLAITPVVDLVEINDVLPKVDGATVRFIKSN